MMEQFTARENIPIRFSTFPLLLITAFILLSLTVLVTSDFQNDAYKFKSSKSMSDILELVPNVMMRRPWPNDLFHTLAYHSTETLNYLRFPSTAIWVVYLGNDTTRPVISEVNIPSGESVHTIVTQFCVEGGFANDPDESIACNGVAVRDAISNIVYGVGYTSTRSTATLEDYVKSRSDVISRINNKFQYNHYLGMHAKLSSELYSYCPPITLISALSSLIHLTNSWTNPYHATFPCTNCTWQKLVATMENRLIKSKIIPHPWSQLRAWIPMSIPWQHIIFPVTISLLLSFLPLTPPPWTVHCITIHPFSLVMMSSLWTGCTKLIKRIETPCMHFVSWYQVRSPSSNITAFCQTKPNCSFTYPQTLTRFFLSTERSSVVLSHTVIVLVSLLVSYLLLFFSSFFYFCAQEESFYCMTVILLMNIPVGATSFLSSFVSYHFPSHSLSLSGLSVMIQIAMYPIPKECLSFNWHGDLWKTIVALRLR